MKNALRRNLFFRGLTINLIMSLRRKVATFANSDSYGSSGISQFQSTAASYGVQIISPSLFPVGQTDFKDVIADALKSGAKIFVFFMAAIDMGRLLIQGTAAGLFGEGTQIIASDATTTSIVWAGIPKDKVASMMKGVIAFAPYTDYSTPEGSKFLKAFIHQANTIEDPVTGLCNNMTDDDGNHLYKRAVSIKHQSSKCGGVDFTRFNETGSNVDNYASYSYDATYAIARAMRVVLIDQNKSSITGEDLYSALINNVSFVGATGAVNFSRALKSDGSRFGEGDRETGITYKILNFSPKVYEADRSGISGFVTVGVWTHGTGNRFTSEVTYNTFDNSIPTDLPPAIILTMMPLQVTILKCFGGILVVTATIFWITLRCYRTTKLVKAIQFNMQSIMIIGALCGAARVFFGIRKVTNVNCSASMWLSHLAFWMIFAPMMLKTWRVHRIINSRNVKPYTLWESFVLRIFGVILLLVLFYLSVLQSQSITTPIKITVRSQIGVQVFLDDQCSRIGNGTSLSHVCCIIPLYSYSYLLLRWELFSSPCARFRDVLVHP